MKYMVIFRVCRLTWTKKINTFEILPKVKYEQDNELLDFTDGKLSLKYLSNPVLLINPQL